MPTTFFSARIFSIIIGPTEWITTIVGVPVPATAATRALPSCQGSRFMRSAGWFSTVRYSSPEFAFMNTRAVEADFAAVTALEGSFVVEEIMAVFSFWARADIASKGEERYSSVLANNDRKKNFIEGTYRIVCCARSPSHSQCSIITCTINASIHSVRIVDSVISDDRQTLWIPQR